MKKVTMPQISYNTFITHKNNLVWQQVLTWMKGVGAVRHMVWRGFFVKDGKVTDIPMYFAFISVDDESGMIGVALSANVRFDVQGRGQQVIDKFVVGKQSEVSEQLLLNVMRQRYVITEVDFSKTPVVPRVGAKSWEENVQVSEKILIRKTLFNKTDQMIALVFLRKLVYSRGQERYVVGALAVPISKGLAEVSSEHRDKTPLLDIKEAMADFHRTVRELKSIGFTEEVNVPDWANAENWDFDLGIPAEAAKKLKNVFDQKIEEYKDTSELDFEEPFGERDEASSMFNSIFNTSSVSRKIKTAQNYYQGQIPDPDQLDQYVGTSGVEASQIRGIFGGVDEAISLVNQFDSSLLLNVAFIYNFSGGGAYGIYMPALDEQIKNSKLKKLLKMDGYAIQDMPNGAFYATHPEKQKDQIDREIENYRKQIGQKGAATFGIDMNKVVGAARSDANESGITDHGDQRLLGVLHLGATMVHEAVHSKGSESEGPSEQAESKFMAWAMPIINQKRQEVYRGQNRLDQYSPLVIDPSKRRMASSSNWLKKAMADGMLHKEAQYGAQFLHNQLLTNNLTPAWSAAAINFIGTGPIEARLDMVRPPPVPAQKISFEGQLREQSKRKWTSSVDATESMEDLLNPEREPLVAYKSTETLLDDSREKPLMLPVPKAMKRKASSYDTGKEAFGYMSNLDLTMEERVQKFDNNDEETTWFDAKFIRNQTRYNPEYGNPMSKEKDIYSWWIDLNMDVETWDTYTNERPSLSTAPWKRTASDHNSVKAFIHLLECTLKNIVKGKIRGTRFLCSDFYVPFIKRFFENDVDLRVDVFGEGQCKVWVVNDSIPTDSVEKAEHYVCGDSEDDADRMTFNYITNMDKSRREAISTMIETVGQAVREVGCEKMFILGDLPLAVKMLAGWDYVRTVDFCSDNLDVCKKIGEIVCNKLGANIEEDNAGTGILVAKWKGATFRFIGDIQENIHHALRQICIDQNPVNCSLYGRLLTPLMLAFDVVTEEVIDLTGEAEPDVEVKVVRTVFEPENAVALNPLVMVDAIYLASVFGFSIDGDFIQAAAKAEFSDPAAEDVWATIRAAGKGKSVEIAEEYGLGEPLIKLIGE
jgi:hypothetical protein